MRQLLQFACLAVWPAIAVAEPVVVGASGTVADTVDRRVRTLLYEAANVMLTRFKGAETQGLGARHRQTLQHAKGADRAGPPPRDHHARNAQARHRVQTGLTQALKTGNRPELPSGSDARGREQMMAPIL
jgi:hypothetical protein